MSAFDTTEEYYARQDEFRRYIKNKVNPARTAHGLKEIDDDSARECFRILDEFFIAWRKP